MLMAPAITELEGVTLYGDDTDFWVFYPIPRFPSVRLSEKGHPIFLLVKYAISDDDLARDPSLPPGGGYLAFDVELTVPEEKLEQIRAQLQPAVDAEWERLRAGGPAERSRRGVLGSTAPPLVAFATPTWTEGHVTLDHPQAELLVQRSVAEGRPSLLAGNIASFSVDLTHAGADLFSSVIRGAEDGSSGGLGILQVKYDLKFWARIPPARVIVHAESREIHRQIVRLRAQAGWRACSRYALRYGPVTVYEAERTGLVTVHVESGSPDVSADALGALREFALQLTTDMLERRFFSTTPPQDSEDAGGAPAGGGPKPLYFRPQYDESTMRLDVEVKQSAVVEWPIHPQGSLSAFFHDLHIDDLRRMVVPVELGSDAFRQLDVTTRVFANFNDPAVAAVEVQIVYEGPTESGEHERKATVLAFSKDASGPQRWRVGQIGSSRTYRWAWRPIFLAHAAPPWSEWVETDSPVINVSVEAPGRVQLQVSAGDVDFTELIEWVEVTLAYEDQEFEVPRREEPLQLSAQAPHASYERLIFTHPRQPIQYRLRFKDRLRGRVFEEPWRSLQGSLLLVNQPFLDALSVVLVPTGHGWDAVALVVVELRYEDVVNDYRQSKTVHLRRADELGHFSIVLRDPSLRTFEYQVSISFRDGAFRQRPWAQATDAQVLHVDVAPPHRLDVQLVAANLNFEITPTVEVVVRYQDAGLDIAESFVFTAPEVRSWRLPLPDGAPLRCSYLMHYHLRDGSMVSSEPISDDDGILVLRPYVAPRPSTAEFTIIARFVDFQATPLVLVDLRLGEPSEGAASMETFAFDSPDSKIWRPQLSGGEALALWYRLTYFDSSGQADAREWTIQQGSTLVVARRNAV